MQFCVHKEYAYTWKSKNGQHSAVNLFVVSFFRMLSFLTGKEIAWTGLAALT